MKTEIERREGNDVKLVIEKRILKSDLKRSQDHLTIPMKEIRNLTFLNDKEQRVLLAEEGTVSVKVLEPCGHDSNTVLKQWNLHSSKTIALRTSWKAVLDKNHDIVDKKKQIVIEKKEFTEGDIVQLWSSRVKKDEPTEEQEQHWLALVNLTRLKEKGEDMVMVEQN